MSTTELPATLGAADSLLRSTSWAAEKLFKSRGNRFPSVLFLAEYAGGRRQRFERVCNNAPAAVSDAALLTELAKDAALDFAETGVVRFACAYLCKRVTVVKPLDPNSTMKPKETRRQGVSIELHGADAPVGIFREILRSAGGKAMLGAAETLEGSFADSPYAKVLELADQWKAVAEAKAAEAAAQAEAAAKVKAAVPIKAKVARAASAWLLSLTEPPRDAGEHGPGSNASLLGVTAWPRRSSRQVTAEKQPTAPWPVVLPWLARRGLP